MQSRHFPYRPSLLPNTTVCSTSLYIACTTLLRGCMPKRSKSGEAGAIFSIRMPASLRVQLERAAAENGRTLNKEIRARLRQSLESDKVVEGFGGRRSYAFFRLLSLLRPMDFSRKRRHWLDDRYLYAQVATAIQVVLLALEPKKGAYKPKDQPNPEFVGLQTAACVLKGVRDASWLEEMTKVAIEDVKRHFRQRDLTLFNEITNLVDFRNLADVNIESNIGEELADVLVRAPNDLLTSPITVKFKGSKT